MSPYPIYQKWPKSSTSIGLPYLAVRRSVSTRYGERAHRVRWAKTDVLVVTGISA